MLENLSGKPRPKSTVVSIENKYYIMAGDKKVPQCHVILIDADTREIIPVALEKWADQKLEYLHTTKDGKSLFFKRVRRTCDELDICRVDVGTGEVTVVLNEVCKPYFSDRKQSITFINNDTEFLCRLAGPSGRVLALDPGDLRAAEGPSLVVVGLIRDPEPVQVPHGVGLLLHATQSPWRLFHCVESVRLSDGNLY